MNEHEVVGDIVTKIDSVARNRGAVRVVRVRVRVGALTRMTPDRLRERFRVASRGTLAEGALLDVSVTSEATHPHARGLVLESVQIES